MEAAEDMLAPGRGRGGGANPSGVLEAESCGVRGRDEEVGSTHKPGRRKRDVGEEQWSTYLRALWLESVGDELAKYTRIKLEFGHGEVWA